MRLPAVAIVATFACGVVLGRSDWLTQRASSPSWLVAGFIAGAVLIGIGIFAAARNRLWPATPLSTIAWLILGVLTVGIAEQPRAASHVLSLVEAGRLNLKTPLRWHGALRDEPARLPFGYGYEVELSGVEYQGRLLTTNGGLRVSFTPEPGQAPPQLHAGEEVAVTAQARLPQVFRDEGVFDRRAYLAEQGVHLVATLRAPELMERTGISSTNAATLFARVRNRLREELDDLFANAPQAGGVLRAMLLGDRSFVDRDEATDFQKTGVFHVLVVAGLHVGAFIGFLFWLARRARLAPFWTALTALALVGAYLSVVEDRPPVLRAALMAGIVLLGRLFFRRLDLLNSAAIAALVLLVAKPLAIGDSSFQLTFLAIGSIAGLALPWLEKTVQPYAKALRGWRDLPRDASHEAAAAQFRIDLRATARWIAWKIPGRAGTATGDALVRGIAFWLRLWELLIVTLVLQIGMLPLMARDFHRITLAAPVVNLLAVPLMGLIVPLGFLALAAGLAFPVVGRLLAVPLGWLVLLLLHAVRWFSGLPHWSYRIPGPPGWLIFLFLAGAVLFCLAFRIPELSKRWIWRSGGAVLAASALAIAISPFAPRWSAGKLELTVLDVGQGDSLFVVSPHGKMMLIDGGGAFGGFSGHEENNGRDPGEEAVSPYLWSRGFQKLDVVALTHAHQDHIGGLAAILQNFRVGELWIGRDVASAALAKLEGIARERKIAIAHERRGTPFSWDGVQTEFLWPELPSEEIGTEPKNNDSLVVRVQFGDRSMMLPGDAEKQAEASILSENPAAALRADVLKVGHHGSKNSTMPAFLAAVQPQVAVISAGEDNPYGHPSPELLTRLEQAGVRILRTDRDGAVHILTDGKQLDVSCFVNCSNKALYVREVLPENPEEQEHKKQQ